MNKKLVAYCDGGLGNRLNSLIGAVYFSKELDLDLTVSWPINKWCAASLNELFDVSFKVNEDSMLQINKFSEKFLLVTHDKQLLQGISTVNPNNYLTPKGIIKYIRSELQGAEGMVYYNSLIPMYVPHESIRRIMNYISVKNEYLEIADDFLNSFGLKDQLYWGLHMRGTDAGFGDAYYKFWFAVASKFSKPVVLCTDDVSIEKKFLSIESIVTRKKISFPKKAFSKIGWNDICIDEYGREFNYNINRDADSIKDSLVDMLLLSRSRILYTSQSTFLDFAYRLQPSSNLFYLKTIFLVKWVRYIYRIFWYKFH